MPRTTAPGDEEIGIFVQTDEHTDGVYSLLDACVSIFLILMLILNIDPRTEYFVQCELHARERPREFIDIADFLVLEDRRVGEPRGERENSYETRIFFFSALRLLNITLTLTDIILFPLVHIISLRMYYVYLTRNEEETANGMVTRLVFYVLDDKAFQAC